MGASGPLRLTSSQEELLPYLTIHIFVEGPITPILPIDVKENAAGRGGQRPTPRYSTTVLVKLETRVATGQPQPKSNRKLSAPAAYSTAM
eukprot:6213558-Pleurochrysis_carterae.AAC.1